MTKEENNIDSHAAALESLANGEDQHVETAIDEGSDGETASFSTSTESPVEMDGDLVAAIGQPSSDSSKQVRVSTAHAKGQHAIGHQLKAMMIPMLLVSGILLIALGGAVAFLKSNELNDAKMVKLAVFVSFPLGAILLVGAWLFHHDVKDAKNDRNNQK